MLEFAKIPGLTKIFNRDDWMKVFLACSTLPDYRESKYSSYYITTDATIRSGKLYYEKNALDKGGYSYDPISHIALTNEKDPTLPESEDYSFGSGDKHEFHEFVLAAKYTGERAVTEDVIFGQDNTYYYKNASSAYSSMTGGDKIVRGYDVSGNPIVYCHINSWQKWINYADDGKTALTGRFTAGWHDSGMQSYNVYYRKTDGTFVKYGKIESTSTTAPSSYNTFVSTYGDLWVLYTPAETVSHFFQVGDLISEVGYTIYDSLVIGDKSIVVDDSTYYYRKDVTAIENTTDAVFKEGQTYFRVIVTTDSSGTHYTFQQLAKVTQAEYEAKTEAQKLNFYYVGLVMRDGVGDGYSQRTLTFTNVTVTRGATITQAMLTNSFNNYMYVAKVAKVNNRTSVIADAATTLYTVDPTYGTLIHVTYLTNGYKIANAAFGDPTDLKFRKSGVYYIKHPGTLYTESGYQILDKSLYTTGRTISDWEAEKGIKVYMLNKNFYVADTDFVGQLTHGQAWYERAGTNYPYEGFVAVTTESSSNAAKGSLFQCKRLTYQLTEDNVHGYTGDGAEAVSKAYYQYDKNYNSYTKVPSTANPVFRNTEGSSFIQTTSDVYFLKNKKYYSDILATSQLRGGTKEQWEADPKNIDYYYGEDGRENEGMRVDSYLKSKVYDRARQMYYREYDAMGNGTWQFNAIAADNRCGLTTDTKWSYTDPSSSTFKTYYFYLGTGYSFVTIPADQHYSVVDDTLFCFEDYNDLYYGYTMLVAGTDYVPGETTAGEIIIPGWDNAKIYVENTASHTLSDTPLAADDVLGLDATVVYHIRNYNHVADEKDAGDMHASTYCYYDVGEAKVTDAKKNVPVADAQIKTYIGANVYGEYPDGILNTYYTMSAPTAKLWNLKFSPFNLYFSPTNTADTTVVPGKQYYQKNESYVKSTDYQWNAYKTYFQEVEEGGVKTYQRAGTMTKCTSTSWVVSKPYWDNVGTEIEPIWVKVDRYCTTKDTTWVAGRSYYKKTGDTYTIVVPSEYDPSLSPREYGLYQEVYKSTASGMNPKDLQLYTQEYGEMTSVPALRTDIYESDNSDYTKVDVPAGGNPKELGLYEFTDSYYGRLINSQSKVIYRAGEVGSMPTECPVCVNYKGEETPAAEVGQKYRDGEELPLEPSLYVESLNGESILPDEYYEECYGLYFWDQFFLDHGISCTPITNVRAVTTGNASDPGLLYVNWTDPTIMIKKDEPTATPDAWVKTTVELYDPDPVNGGKWTILVSTSCNAYQDTPAVFELTATGLKDIAYELASGHTVKRESYVPNPYDRLKNGYLIITAISASGTQAVYNIKTSDIVWSKSTAKQLVNLASGKFMAPGIASELQTLTGKAIPGVKYIDLSTGQEATDVFERVTPLIPRLAIDDETAKYKIVYSKDTPVIKVVFNDDETAITSYTPIIVGETVPEGLDVTFPEDGSHAYLCTLASPKPEVTIQEIIKDGAGTMLFDIGSEISIPDPSTITGTKATESTSSERATVIDFDRVRLNRDVEMCYIHPEELYTIAKEKYYMRSAVINIETVEAGGTSAFYSYVEVPVPVGTPCGTTLYARGEVPHYQYYTKANQPATMIGDAIYTAINYNESGWEAIVNDPGIPIYFRNPSLSRGGYFEYEDDEHSISFRVTAPTAARSYDYKGTDGIDSKADWEHSTTRDFLNANHYDKITDASETVVAGKTYYAYSEATHKYLAFSTTTKPSYFDGAGTGANPWKFKTDFSVTVEGITYSDYYKFVGYMGGSEDADNFFEAVRSVRNQVILRKVVVEDQYVLTCDMYYQAGKIYYTRSGEGTEEDPYVYTEITDVPAGQEIPSNTVYEKKKMPTGFTDIQSTVVADKFWLPSLNQIGVSSVSSPDSSQYIGSFPPPPENTVLLAFNYNAYSQMRYKGGTPFASSWWRLNPKIVPRTGTAQEYYTRTAVDYDASKKTTIESTGGTTYEVGFDMYVATIMANGSQAAHFATDVNPKCYVYFTIA